MTKNKPDEDYDHRSSLVTPRPSDDQLTAIKYDLFDAVYVEGRQRATVAFREKLCAKHNISMEALVEAIEMFNAEEGYDYDEEEEEEVFEYCPLLTIVRARPKVPPKPKDTP
jgi:hypothetical protein